MPACRMTEQACAIAHQQDRLELPASDDSQKRAKLMVVAVLTDRRNVAAGHAPTAVGNPDTCYRLTRSATGNQPQIGPKNSNIPMQICLD